MRLMKVVPFLLPLLLFLLPIQSKSQAISPAPVTGYNCSTNRTIYPCQSFAFYRAGIGNGPTDLTSVGDLFGVSRLMVARASNLSNTNSNLTLGQPLLVPLPYCNCPDAYNRSYWPVQYQINSGDTYYLVSTTKLQNLTQYQAVEVVNPTLVATNLTIGVYVTFPIFCQCPSGTDNTTALVSYVVQPNDTFASIAAGFGTTVQSLANFNGPEKSVQPYSNIVVPLSQSQFPPPILATNSSTTAPAASPPAQSPPSSVVKKNQHGVVIGLSVALGVVGLLWLLQFVILAWCWRKVSSRRGEQKASLGGGEAMYVRSGSGGEKLMTDISEWLDKYRVFKVEELRRATGDFDDGHLIQGSVYKGDIDGAIYAVKKMKWNAYEELKILQKVNHTNLVKLEGFCIDSVSGSCYLVYEYVENGSLELWLRDPDMSGRLDWRTRLRIALDLAHGLQYIHEHTWPRVVHKDIKSSNVLLDAKLHAKIANFGLAKTGLNAVTTHIVGTQGYIAPEYLTDGLVTTKMDVFAYGVVLLELVSGKEAVDEHGEMLWAEADEMVFRCKEGRIMEAKVMAWMDSALAGQTCPIDSIVTVVNVAKACLQREPSKRPSMVEVAYTLSKADELFSDYSGDSLNASGSGEVVAR